MKTVTQAVLRVFAWPSCLRDVRPSLKRILMRVNRVATVAFTCASVAVALTAQQPPASKPAPAPNPRLEQLKKEAIADIDARAQFTQQFVDQVFSYGELGFQEYETSAYITAILEKNGFFAVAGHSRLPAPADTHLC